jgi:hypothetical protein
LWAKPGTVIMGKSKFVLIGDEFPTLKCAEILINHWP